MDVYLCFYCGEEFSCRSVLHDHQSICEMKPPELQAITPPPGHASQSVYSETRHDGSQVSPLPPLLCASSIITPDSSPEETFTINYPHSGKDTFISSLGLLAKRHVASQLSRKRRNTECENIDIEDDLPVCPSPRTPKLLISHLSKDSNGDISPSPSPFKNMFCLSPFKRRRSLFSHTSISEEIPEEEKEDVENRPEENKDISHSKPATVGTGRSLYNLDVSSPLGQFVIKHYKSDPSLHILSDLESHCSTEATNHSEASIRGLRARSTMFPTTFRGYSSKNVLSMHFHLFKFNKFQKREFLRRVNSGLDCKSRQLKRLMKPCTVRLTHLRKKELKLWMASQNDLTVDLTPLTDPVIAYWTNPKSQPAIFPDGLSFSSPNVKNILGLRTSQDKSRAGGVRLSVANFVSEEMCAELHQNRRSIYQSLMYDSYSSKRNSSDVVSRRNSHVTVESLLVRSQQCPLRTLPTNININEARVKLNFNGKLGVLPFSSFTKSVINSNGAEELMKLTCGSSLQVRPVIRRCGGHTVRLKSTQDEGESIGISPNISSPKKAFSSSQTFSNIVQNASRSAVDCLDKVQPDYERITAIRKSLRSPLMCEDKYCKMDLTSAITLSESPSVVTLPESSSITNSISSGPKSLPSTDKATIERAARALKIAVRNVASGLTQTLHKKDSVCPTEYSKQVEAHVSTPVKTESSVVEDDRDIINHRNKLYLKLKQRQRKSTNSSSISNVLEVTPIINGSLVAAAKNYVESESSPAIRRLARRGGVEKISGLNYEGIISIDPQLEASGLSSVRCNSDKKQEKDSMGHNISTVRISSRRSSSPLVRSTSNRNEKLVKSKNTVPTINMKSEKDSPDEEVREGSGNSLRVGRGLRELNLTQDSRNVYPSNLSHQGSRSPRSGSPLTRHMTVLQRAELRKSLSTSFLDKVQKV